MIVKVLTILILLVYFCTAFNQQNEAAGTPQYAAYQPATPDNVKKVGDCNTVPNPPVEKNPADTGRLVSQSLKDETQSKQQNNPVDRYGSQKTLYVYDDDSYEAGPRRNLKESLSANKGSDATNASKAINDETSQSSESAELRKLVKKCLTTKHRSPNKTQELSDSEELNTRRKSNDPNVEYGLGNSPQDLNRNGGPNVVGEQTADPTNTAGLKRLTNSNSDLLLSKNKQVCYACSSVNNPNCWVPNQFTTIKLCKRGNTACITKTYVDRLGRSVIIRDCAQPNSCKANNPGIEPVYTTCSQCQSNLCNDTSGASALKSINSLSFILGLILIGFAKKHFE